MEHKIELTYDENTKYFTVRDGDRYAELTFEEMLGTVTIKAIHMMGLGNFCNTSNMICSYLKTKEQHGVLEFKNNLEGTTIIHF